MANMLDIPGSLAQGLYNYLDDLRKSGELFELQVCLHAFGALSEKPLQLKGSWPGAKYLKEISAALKIQTAEREKIKISKPMGKILECIIMETVVWNYLPPD